MRTKFTPTLASLVILASATYFSASVPLVRAQPPSKDKKNLDLADFLDLGEYYVKPVAAQKDPKTGFIVGGKNESALIKGLKEINGRKIADLEKDMRPGAKSDKGVGSTKGFLGKDEGLLEVLATDNELVLGELKSSHQELAKHLHALGTIGLWQFKHKKEEAEFVYHGRRFKVKTQIARGFQLSPFLDDTKTNIYAEVQNLDNGNKIGYSLLVPYMIERYGFYEGKGTPYRVDPREVMKVFDFLKVAGGTP